MGTGFGFWQFSRDCLLVLFDWKAEQRGQGLGLVRFGEFDICSFRVWELKALGFYGEISRSFRFRAFCLRELSGPENRIRPRQSASSELYFHP